MHSKLLHCLTSVGVLVAFGLAGCQTAPKVQSEFDTSANFTAAKTFAVRPLPKSIPGVDPGLILRVGPAAMDAVRASLKGKGYTEVAEAKKADIAVLVHGKSVPKTEVTAWGFTPTYGRAGWYRGYPYGGYSMGNVSVDQYDEGTLIVEVYDVNSKNMIWVGWVTAEATANKSEQASKVAAGITKILATYPSVGNIPVAPAKK
jgi:hypothetical protein